MNKSNTKQNLETASVATEGANTRADRPTTAHQRNQAWRYLSKIRNLKKRWYGQHYLEHLLYCKPEPETQGLSFMGAQAVRIGLHKIIGQMNIKRRSLIG